MKYKRMLIVGILFILIPIILGTLNFVLSIISRTGEFDVQTIFSGNIYSNWRYNFWETLLDFDFFLSEFWYNILFCIIVAAICLLYGQSSDYVKIQPDYKTLSTRTRIFGIIGATILLIAVLGSLFDWGLVRSYLSGQTFNLWLGWIYDEQFSNLILPLSFLFGGFPALLYLMARSTAIENTKWNANRIGVWMLGIAIALVQFLIIINPIDIMTIFDGTAFSILIYTVFDLLFIIGLICVLEARSRKMHEILNSSAPSDVSENLIIVNDNVNPIGNENLSSESKGNAVLSDDQPSVSSILRLKNQIDQTVTNLKIKTDPRLIRHVYRYVFFLTCVVICAIIVVSYYNAFLTIDHFKLVQHTLSFIFRVMLTLSLYYFGAYLISERYLEEEGDK